VLPPLASEIARREARVDKCREKYRRSLHHRGPDPFAELFKPSRAAPVRYFPVPGYGLPGVGGGGPAGGVTTAAVPSAAAPAAIGFQGFGFPPTSTATTTSLMGGSAPAASFMSAPATAAPSLFAAPAAPNPSIFGQPPGGFGGIPSAASGGGFSSFGLGGLGQTSAVNAAAPFSGFANPAAPFSGGFANPGTATSPQPGSKTSAQRRKKNG
jgi:hypothetical protein